MGFVKSATAARFTDKNPDLLFENQGFLSKLAINDLNDHQHHAHDHGSIHLE